MRDKKIQIGVIDGQGGGMGRVLVERIRAEYPSAVIRALGTNSLATASMIKSGADSGASGENAVVFNAGKMDILIGPIGVAMANAQPAVLEKADYITKSNDEDGVLHVINEFMR